MQRWRHDASHRPPQTQAAPAAVALQLAFLEDWHWASGSDVPELEWSPKQVNNGAQVLILPTSPYFVPDDGVQAALKLAALRGVNVRMLIHERTDNPLTSWAASVGTVNLDNRSFRLNFEITAWVFDPAFAAQTAAMFEADFARSRAMGTDELAQRAWWQRMAARAAYRLAPVL